MKSLKNISFLIVTALLLSLTVFPASAEYKESNEIVYEQAFDLLHSLGLSVSDRKDFSLDMTRGEFCDMVARFINIINYDAPVCYYPDVTRTHTYSQSIYALSNFGYVKGYPDGNFLPDNPVTANQAAKIVVKALGYTDEILGSDAYLTSYIMKAREIKLFNNISAADEEVLSVGEAFVFIENALSAPIVEFGMKGGNVTYYVNENDTAAETYHSLIKDKGIVDSNYITTLSGSSKPSIGENYITIDGKVFSTKDRSYKQYLGYRVEYYVNDDDEILYLRPYRNTVYEINYDDVTDFSLSSISYYNNGKTKKLNFSRDVDFIYNGVSCPEFDPGIYTYEYFDGHKGSFILVDNDGDETYDCVFAEEYVTYIVNYTDEETKTIYFKNYNDGEVSAVSYENADILEITRPDGLEIPISVILTNEAASVYESMYGEYVRIIASTDKVNGTVKGLYDGGGLIIAHEDGTEARYNLDCRDSQTVDALIPGFSGAFVLNFKGEICGATNFFSEAYKYGYIIKVFKSEETDDKLLFKVLCADNKIRIFNADKKTVIDGSKYKDMEELYAKFTKTDLTTGSDYTRSQIIRYKDNEDNTYIRNIDTAELGDKENRVNSIEVERYSGAYRPAQMYIYGKVEFDENNLIVFVVPKVAQGSNSDINNATNKDYFVRYNLSGWWTRETMDADAVINDKDGGISNCVAAYYDYYPEMPIGGNPLYYNTSPTTSMVDSVSYMVNEDDEVVPVIKLIDTALIEAKECGNMECALKPVYDADGNIVPGESKLLERGDVVGCYYDTNGILQYTEVKYDVSRTDNARFFAGEYKNDSYACGIVYSKSGKTMKMTSVVNPDAPAAYDRTDPLATFNVSNDALKVNIYPESMQKFFVYDSENKTVRKGNIYDIKDYKNNPDDTSVMYIKWNYGVPTVICVYN